MTESIPKNIQEVIKRIEKGDYDFISKLVFEDNILTYFTVQELEEFTKDSASHFLRNIMRTSVSSTYIYIGDFKRGNITDGYFSIHTSLDNLDDLEDLDDLDDDTFDENIVNYNIRFNRIFESIRESNEEVYFAWLLNLLKTAEPLDIANLISSGLLYDIIDNKPQEIVKLLEVCDTSVLKIIVMTFDYILVDEHFYHLERDFVVDRFSYLADFLTRRLIYRINSLYDEGGPKIMEYLEMYRWHNADFDPDNYKKMDEWSD